MIDEALGVPYRTEALVAAGLHPDDGFCFKCERAYCRKHWNVSSTGYGTCPEGHGTTLDPHWSPDW